MLSRSRKRLSLDALLTAQLLRQTGKVDPQRVYVLGHSLGGMLALWHSGSRTRPWRGW